MKSSKFTNGVFVKKDYTEYGAEMIDVSIKLEDFKTNNITPKGYVNFQIRKSKKGDYYAVNNIYIKDSVHEEFLPHACYEGRKGSSYYQ